MHIIEQRLLRGPNLYAQTPCLMAVLDLQPLQDRQAADTPQLYPQLEALLPTLRERAGTALALRTGEPTGYGPVVDLVLRELQALAGSVPTEGHSGPVRGQPSQFRIVCGYQIEQVATEALALAVQIVDTLAQGAPFEIEAPLAALRELAQQRAMGTSTAAVIAAARKRGIPTLRLSEESNLFQLGWGSRQKRLQATITGDAGTLAVRIASDKQLTKTLLAEAGVPVPRGGTVASPEQAQRLAASLGVGQGKIVTVKPLDANHGKGVTTRCATPDEVATAYELARRHSRHIIVERFLEGRDYRVLVTGDKVAAAAWRRPPEVTGDGVHTIAELVAQENRNPARGEGHANILTRIPLDDSALAILREQGYETGSIAPAGASVVLRGNANLSSGGTAEDVTDLLPAETRSLCVRAARKVGLDVAGIDIICSDISQPLREQGGGVIEVNAAPGIRMHQYPSAGLPRDAGGAIVEAMYPQGEGRIPVIAVTGTNGKTTTCLMLAHAARMAGLGTGVTTTEGVFINGERIVKGDCAGYWSARTVLTAPEVDFAVLETARGGILKRGLAFDRCDVGVVLNVAADHLGLDGIDTVADLAQVKAVVARSAARAVVLNAQDFHCAAIDPTLSPEVERLYFSLDPDHPVLLRHLERGGRGAYLQDGQLVIADGTRRHALLAAASMPAALGGHARYNIANALASAAALLASGFELAQIAAGLASFVCDNRTNPLRSNLFRLRDDITLIVDYAHNPAAYTALGQMARSMASNGRRLIGVVTAPGDRRDADLHAMGAACAAHFDELVVYESARRGREAGDTGRLITGGVEQARIDACCQQWQQIDNVRAALDHALARCQPGDVLVYSCPSSLADLIAAVRVSDPAGAQRIADEVNGVAIDHCAPIP